jgi:hypothetical protein
MIVKKDMIKKLIEIVSLIGIMGKNIILIANIKIMIIIQIKIHFHIARENLSMMKKNIIIKIINIKANIKILLKKKKLKRKMMKQYLNLNFSIVKLEIMKKLK